MAYLSQWMHLPNLDLVGEVHTLNPKAEIANRAIQEYIDAVKYGLNRTIEVEVK